MNKWQRLKDRLRGCVARGPLGLKWAGFPRGRPGFDSRNSPLNKVVKGLPAEQLSPSQDQMSVQASISWALKILYPTQSQDLSLLRCH